MRLLLAHLKPYKAAVALTLLLATITQLLVLAEPQLLRLMIDRYVMRAASLTRRRRAPRSESGRRSRMTLRTSPWR